MLFDLIKTSFNGRSKIDQSVKDIARGWFIHTATIAYGFCQKMTSVADLGSKSHAWGSDCASRPSSASRAIRSVSPRGNALSPRPWIGLPDIRRA
jgi:hypothetical protein